MTSSRAYAALAAAGSLWGIGFLFGKIALTELTVPHMIFYRLSLACVGFVPVLLLRRPVLAQRDWPTVLLAAVLGVPLVYLVQFEGLARTTVAHASLMVAGFPILLGIAAALVARERPTITHWILLVVSACGALLIAAGASTGTQSTQGPTVFGDGLVVLSLFAGVGWVLTTKRLMQRHDPTGITALIQIVGTIPLAAWVLATAGVPPVRLSLHVWGALAAQGVLATTAANLFWNWGVSRVPMSQAGVFVNLEPVIGTVLGVVVLGDRLGWTGIIGGALIVGAAVAVTRGQAQVRSDAND